MPLKAAALFVGTGITGQGPTGNPATTCDLPPPDDRFRRDAAFWDRSSRPVDGNLAISWTGPASDTTVATKNAISPCPRALEQDTADRREALLKQKDAAFVSGRRRDLDVQPDHRQQAQGLH
jgi:hypothetical protein